MGEESDSAPVDALDTPLEYRRPAPRPPPGSRSGMLSNASNVVINGGVFYSTESGNLDDPSTKIWTIYVAEAEKFDKALVERWKGDMDGILIFAGLFSAAITAFIIESYKQLQSDSGNTTTALLSQISQQLALLSNGSQAPAVISNIPQNFSPPSSAILVNAFWFLSLALSIITALTATLVQQWARHYLDAVERRPSPQIRARIRAYLYAGITSYHVTAVVEGIPTLLHVSVFFFFVGLVQFLFSIDSTIAYLILSLTVIFALIYLGITFGPIFIHNFPYRSPLSTAFWHLSKIFTVTVRRRADPKGRSLGIFKFKEMYEIPEKIAMENTILRDQEALRWTLHSVIDDRDLEPFVDGIAGYLLSDISNAKKSMRGLLCDQEISFLNRITGLLKTCTSPESMIETARVKRAVTCLTAISALLPLTGYWESDGNIAFPAGSELLNVLDLLKKDKKSTDIKEAAASSLDDVISKLCSLVQQVFVIRERLTVNRARHVRLALRILPDKACIKMLQIIVRYLGHMDTYGSGEAQYQDNHKPLQLDPLTLSIALKDFIHGWLTPFLLSSKDDPIDGQEHFEVREMFLQLVSLIPWFQWHSNIYEIIHKLKAVDGPLKQYANCCAAHLAVALQSDMICAMWSSKNIREGSDRALYSHGRSKLGDLNMLGALLTEHSDAEGKIIVENLTHELQVSVQLQADSSFTDLVRLPGQLQQQIKQLGIDHHPSLSKSVLSLSAAYGNKIRLPLVGQLLLARGRIAVLVAFLHSSQILPTTELGLVMTLQMLHLICRNMEAHFASSTTQVLLVDLISKSISKYEDPLSNMSPVLRPEIVLAIIDVLISILGTVGTQDAKSAAKKFLDSSKHPNQWHQEAVKLTVDKLISSASPTFSPLPIESEEAKEAANHFLNQLFIPKVFPVNSWKFKTISVQDRTAFDKLWSKCVDRQTGYLKQDRLGHFLHHLTGVFESRIYRPKDSIQDILTASKSGDHEKSGPVEGLSLKKFTDALNAIDYADAKKRRRTYECLYHEVIINCEQGKGIPKHRMRLILSFYKLAPKLEDLPLKEYVIRTSIDDVVKELVVLDFIRACLECRREKKLHDERKSKT